jgi:hypothetical protein
MRVVKPSDEFWEQDLLTGRVRPDWSIAILPHWKIDDVELWKGTPGGICAKLLNADPPVTYAVVLNTGDEVTSELGKFVREREVEAASVTAIGAFQDALLGYFDWQTKQYTKIPVDEQVEVLSLLGDVAVAVNCVVRRINQGAFGLDPLNRN